VKAKFDAMPENRKSQLIHLAFSVITIACTMGAVLTGYWQIQAGNERIMAEFRVSMTDLSRRVLAIEGVQASDKNDRLTLERRLTGLEVTQSSMLGVLREVRDDVRALRGESRRP
jgi:hypothetical protein